MWYYINVPTTVWLELGQKQLSSLQEVTINFKMKNMDPKQKPYAKKWAWNLAIYTWYSKSS